MHKLYIDRRLDSIDCLVTLHKDGKVVQDFERLPARSGQRGYTHTNWVTGKSPTPFGHHLLRAQPGVLQMAPRGTPFFPICTDQKHPSIILGPDGKMRVNAGLHFENEWPGTEGCTAAIRNERAERLFKYIESLTKTEPWIEVEVL